MRFLFDSAVVGVRPRMLAARKRRCGGRAVYCGKNERIRTGKIRAGWKNTRGGRSGRTYRRYKRKACGLFLPANSEADLRGACVGESGGTGEERALRAAEAKRQEGSAPYRQKRSREKYAAGKGKACVRTGTENCGKTGKNELFLWIFHTKKANKGKKNAKNGLKTYCQVNFDKKRKKLKKFLKIC